MFIEYIHTNKVPRLNYKHFTHDMEIREVHSIATALYRPMFYIINKH